ncbi:hypothetical protein O181_068735 [Austropuccinia psidii MF-1]|uniref:Uncharacterized protein n=1 Tax=Austropuccinia psidii MF-1 TaxID=1389203 RepID=A0A9Q3ET42_9BASI|nr:hypothetical protein [Austropuccinia psidii MF-1]
MLRFPTSIPLRPAELSEFRDAILSQKKSPDQNKKTNQVPQPEPESSTDVLMEPVERERREIRDRAKKSKSERVGA